MPREPIRAEMEKSVDRADGALERAAEVEVGDVPEDDRPAVAESAPSELEHLRRAVDPGDVDSAVGEGREHPSAAASRLEHRCGAAEPFDEPVHLLGDVP